MKLYAALLLSVLTLSACGSSTSTSGGSDGANPSPGSQKSVEQQDLSNFEILEKAYQEKAVHIQTRCGSFSIPCADIAYPETKMQLMELNPAIMTLEAIADMKARTPFSKRKIEFEQKVYRKTYVALRLQQDRLVQKIGLIELRLAQSKDKFAEIQTRKQNAIDSLVKLGCKVADSGELACSNEMKSAADGLLHLKQFDASMDYQRALEAESELYKSFPSPGLTETRNANQKFEAYRGSSRVLIRCWDDAKSLIQATRALAPKESYLATSKYFENLRESLGNRCDANLFANLSAKLERTQKFFVAFDEVQGLLQTRAFDHLELGEEYRRYVGDAYNFFPASGKGLEVVIPAETSVDRLTQFFKQLDTAGNSNFRKRADIINKIEVARSTYPKDFEGVKLKMRIEIDPKLDQIHYNLSDLLQLLTTTPDGWVAESLDMAKAMRKDSPSVLQIIVALTNPLTGPYDTSFTDCQDVTNNVARMTSKNFKFCSMEAIMDDFQAKGEAKSKR